MGFKASSHVPYAGVESAVPTGLWRYSLRHLPVLDRIVGFRLKLFRLRAN
jgi:hypothetical protein